MKHIKGQLYKKLPPQLDHRPVLFYLFVSETSFFEYFKYYDYPYFLAWIIISSILTAASGMIVPGPNIAIAPAL